MSFGGIKIALLYLATICLGAVASFTFLLNSNMKQELPHIIEKPTPTISVTEEQLELTQEEASTMSASFIKEFETLLASRSGEKK